MPRWAWPFTRLGTGLPSQHWSPGWVLARLARHWLAWLGADRMEERTIVRCQAQGGSEMVGVRFTWKNQGCAAPFGSNSAEIEDDKHQARSEEVDGDSGWSKGGRSTMRKRVRDKGRGERKK